jgi:hypothetical protein
LEEFIATIIEEARGDTIGRIRDLGMRDRLW